MAPTPSGSISLMGSHEAIINPSMLTTAAPRISDELDLRLVKVSSIALPLSMAINYPPMV